MSGKPIVEAVSVTLHSDRAGCEWFIVTSKDHPDSESEVTPSDDPALFDLLKALTAAQQQEHEREHLRRVALDYAREIEDEDARAAQQQGQVVAWPTEAKHAGSGDWEARTSICAHTMSEAQARVWNACLAACKAANTAPPPSVPAGAAWSDEQIIAACNSAGVRWIEPDGEEGGFPGGFDITHMPEMRRLFAALAQQPGAVECPHRTRCDCLAACKYGYAGDGATQHQEPKSHG